ncbi:hypothetical protein BJV78DRAFT_1174326, partial [Lactifluus subvellereus]
GTRSRVTVYLGHDGTGASHRWPSRSHMVKYRNERTRSTDHLLMLAFLHLAVLGSSNILLRSCSSDP